MWQWIIIIFVIVVFRYLVGWVPLVQGATSSVATALLKSDIEVNNMKSLKVVLYKY